MDPAAELLWSRSAERPLRPVEEVPSVRLLGFRVRAAERRGTFGRCLRGTCRRGSPGDGSGSHGDSYPQHQRRLEHWSGGMDGRRSLSALPRSGDRHASRASSVSSLNRTTGFNVVGYLSGNLGLGVAARHVARLILDRKLPLAVVDLDPGFGRGGHDQTFLEYAVIS